MRVDRSYGNRDLAALSAEVAARAAEGGPARAARWAVGVILRARALPGAAPLAPPPEVEAAEGLALRVALDRAGIPVYEREEALALLRYAYFLGIAEACDYDADVCMALASRLSPPWLRALLESEGRGEAAGLLGLALEEFSLEGDAIGPLLDDTQLDPAHPEAPRVAGAIRWERLYGGIRDVWAAWARLPGFIAPARACLRIQVAVPGAPPPPLDALPGGAGRVLTMEDVKDARGAQARRRAAVLAIVSSLRGGVDITWLANSTTQESRRAPIQAAREAGARVEMLFYGGSVEALYDRIGAEGWTVPERAFMRSASILEGPRPHEAERVFVYSGSEAIDEIWTVGIDGEIARTGPGALG